MASVASETSRSANPAQPASAADRTDRSSAPDVVVVGAGFAGLYMLHKLRTLGFSARVVEAADDVGGTWYWNRYPGARCDITTADYAYSFDPELETAWSWSEKYATQPEILRYAQFVAERYDLRRDIDFGTRVDQARWDDAAGRWQIHTSRDETLTPRFYIMASGVLSAPKEPDIPGAGSFEGRGLQHQPLAARWRRLLRQARGGDRHRLVGHPVHPADRAAGGAAHGVPAHAQLLGAGAQRASRTRAAAAAQRRPCRLSAGGQAVARRRADAAEHGLRPLCAARAARPAAEPGLGVRRAGRGDQHLCRPGPVRGFQRAGVRVRARQDPRRGQGPGHRRGAVPEGPPLRHQAAVPGHRLLRDLQPPQRAPGRPEAHADRGDHRERHRRRRRVVAVRRHRLRHRLRRDDRPAGGGGHRRARRPDVEATSGPTDRRAISA